MLVKTFCAAVNGMEVTTVTVEVSITRGVLFHLTGLADGAVKESHDRIAAALLNNGYKFPVADITANLAPADLKKEGSSFDLPLAIAILAANEKMSNDLLRDYMLVGELSLDGTLQPVKGILPIAIKARAEKFKGIIVPKAMSMRLLLWIRWSLWNGEYPTSDRLSEWLCKRRTLFCRYTERVLRASICFRPRLC